MRAAVHGITAIKRRNTVMAAKREFVMKVVTNLHNAVPSSAAYIIKSFNPEFTKIKQTFALIRLAICRNMPEYNTEIMQSVADYETFFSLLLILISPCAKNQIAGLVNPSFVNPFPISGQLMKSRHSRPLR